ncbi:class I SAM-dependent methyltransferase [Prochlorothrix hollandica]|uniref:class I SAM-dependent methyltransferase n=1 Tax=Prochlorothrix hollandica TaxID=1223 RepID=UPI003340FC75
MAIKLKFTEKVKDYSQYRADYPDAMFKALLADLGALDQVQAVDVGAGTGIASRQLADRGVRVIAIEPDAAMVAGALPHPQVDFRLGSGETTGLPDHTVDLITCFQSFHWLQFRPSLKEFHRILKPGGKLALVWNWWDSRDLFSRQYNQALAETAKSYKYADLKPTSIENIEKFFALAQRIPSKVQMKLLDRWGWLPYFEEVQTQYFTFTQAVDEEMLGGLARSYSFIPETGSLWEALAIELSQLIATTPGNPCLQYRTRLVTAKTKV